MRIRLLKTWDEFRSSFWFVPACMSLTAVAFGVALPLLDAQLKLAEGERFGWLETEADTARAMLSVVAGTMFTLMGLVASVTVVILSITTSQFGPRLLRAFMTDFATQFALGIFVATGLYSLMLQWIVMTGQGAKQPFVPHISIATAVLLTVFSLGVLIYFIHHIAVIIQAPIVVTAITQELHSTIDRLFPEAIGTKPPNNSESCPQAGALRPGWPIIARHEGYLQGVDGDKLLSIACDRNVTLRLTCRPGDFVTQDMPLLEICTDEHDIDAGVDGEPKFADEIREAFVIDRRRTPRQDVRYATQELVEIAVRALSPGINDPFTAITCIDRLSGALIRLAERQIPSPYRYDDSNRLRVVAKPVMFAELLDFTLNPIRNYSNSSLAVWLALAEALSRIAPHTIRSEDREAIRLHAELIRHGAELALAEERDLAQVQIALVRLSSVLNPQPALPE